MNHMLGYYFDKGVSDRKAGRPAHQYKTLTHANFKAYADGYWGQQPDPALAHENLSACVNGYLDTAPAADPGLLALVDHKVAEHAKLQRETAKLQRETAFRPAGDENVHDSEAEVFSRVAPNGDIFYDIRFRSCRNGYDGYDGYDKVNTEKTTEGLAKEAYHIEKLIPTEWRTSPAKVYTGRLVDNLVQSRNSPDYGGQTVDAVWMDEVPPIPQRGCYVPPPRKASLRDQAIGLLCVTYALALVLFTALAVAAAVKAVIQ